MPTNILMPALSPTMEKGNLAKWLKKEGDKVKSGDVIAEIETDKATMEVEAVDEGTLAKIVVPEGTEDVAVNSVIAVLAGEGEDVKAAASGAQQQLPQAAPQPRPLGQAAAAPAPQPACPTRAGGCTAAAASGVARRLRLAAPKTNGHARVFSSPLARRLAKDAGDRHRDRAGLRSAWPRHCARYRESEVRPGPEGAGGEARAPQVAPAMSDQQVRAMFADGSYEVVPHDNMRKDHRAALVTVEADDPAFLSHHRLRHRQACCRAGRDQRRGAEGQGRQADLQALGQ